MDTGQERAGCLGQCVAEIRLQLDVGCGDVELELLDTGRNVRLSDEQELRILDELRAAGALLLGTGQGAVAALRGASEGLATAAALAPAGDVVLVATGFSQRHAPVACRFGKWTIGDVGRGQSQCQPY